MQVVKQILAFARQQKDDVLQITDLTALISDIVEILKVTSPGETEIRWSPPENDILYPINPTRFQQLVMNLCINAVHAMPEGGTLEITLTGRKDKRVLIEVSDTGTGIPEENVDKIFTPLFTTKEKDRGTGLGLFVVKQIVEEIHGTIHVKSRPGAGTTFEIEFPADK
jgi:two-component system, cell cycle sensor histidine kinase and response regulator CckA